MTPFERAIDFILRDDIEGGYSNDPRDPGGETKYGISARSHPGVDIANLTREGAAEIYKREYWDAMRCDELPANLAIVIFDCAVNQGKGMATRILQTAGGVDVDGLIGPRTIEAALYVKITDVLTRRAKVYAATRNFEVYGRGWFRRLFELASVISKGN